MILSSNVKLMLSSWGIRRMTGDAKGLEEETIRNKVSAPTGSLESRVAGMAGMYLWSPARSGVEVVGVPAGAFAFFHFLMRARLGLSSWARFSDHWKVVRL